MYLVPIHVPIYRDGRRLRVTSEWRRALVLLRDSLQGKYGTIRVVAPSISASATVPDQALADLGPVDEIELIPSFDLNCRAREYWLRHRRSWREVLARNVAAAEVVHTALDDLYRPIAFEGVREAIRSEKPTIFVQDTDIVLRAREMSRGGPLRERAFSCVYASLYERASRWSVRHADLSLLKGQALMARYARFSRNPREFHDTSYRLEELVPPARLEARLATLGKGRTTRLVYCGRLVERKGVALSLRLLARAIGQGADLTLDVIGEGPQRQHLEAASAAPPLIGRVRFLGAMNYDRGLLQKLADYDALLFTPVLEDTPRMIFDGYAAGLPLVATDIEYVKERHHAEGATLLLDRTDEARSAALLSGLSRNPAPLAALARAARASAEHHAAENWYRRRAEWTFEAVERHRCGVRMHA